MRYTIFFNVIFKLPSIHMASSKKGTASPIGPLAILIGQIIKKPGQFHGCKMPPKVRENQHHSVILRDQRPSKILFDEDFEIINRNKWRAICRLSFYFVSI